MREEDGPRRLPSQEVVECKVPVRRPALKVGEGRADLDPEVLGTHEGRARSRLRSRRGVCMAGAVHVTEVGLARRQLLHLEVAEPPLGLLRGNARTHDDAAPGPPVPGRRQPEVLRQEEGLDDPQHLDEVAARGRGVEDRRPVGPVGADHEERARGHRTARGVPFPRVQHAKPGGDLPLLIRDQREAQTSLRELLRHSTLGVLRTAPPDSEDVLGPLSVIRNSIATEADQLHASCRESGHESAADRDLRGADWREVPRVREKNRPWRKPIAP
mmetsp:Transcript_30595/g.90816  ORF Transcript_30595/g.90816 Transcript_30595/m.90816 type:complete len:272 (+) Transcript_30595:676-1491(+)